MDWKMREFRFWAIALLGSWVFALLLYWLVVTFVYIPEKPDWELMESPVYGEGIQV